MQTYQLQEGIILTENEHDTIEINGFRILVIPIWKWLLFRTHSKNHDEPAAATRQRRQTQEEVDNPRLTVVA